MAISSELLVNYVSWYSDSQRFSDFLSFDDQYEAYLLRPTSAIWRNYLSVSYLLLPNFEYLYELKYLPFLSTICFDINTGDIVDLRDVLPRTLDYSKAVTFEVADYRILDDGSYNVEARLADGYVPASGSVMTVAWIAYSKLFVLVTEPSGRNIEACFDFQDIP
ncbi:MAG: hypothetical protein FWH33_07120 [Oscillospiraceae bacterium]|nr:hypothetical protein [Oscillospiraceae bacterium]